MKFLKNEEISGSTKKLILRKNQTLNTEHDLNKWSMIPTIIVSNESIEDESTINIPSRIELVITEQSLRMLFNFHLQWVKKQR